MIDESRIEDALREGPPFRTRYLPGALATGRAALPPAPLRASLVLVAVVVMLALVVGGEALIGSGIIKLPVLTNNSGTSSPTPNQPSDSNGPSSWTATSSLVTPRAGGHTVTLLDDGRVLVAGGSDNSQVVASAELFDPASLTWVAVGDMTQPRSAHTATLLRDGRVLVAGGASDALNFDDVFWTAELYDPARGTWQATGSMTQGRTGHTATLLADGTVLVAGGHTGAGNDWLDSAEIYHPSTGTWTAAGNLNQARGSHTATLLFDGRVLVAGGVVGGMGCCRPLTSAELYDPQSGSWMPTTSMIDLRGGSSAALLVDGSVLVAGEINGNSVTTAERYDPGTELWSRTGELIDPNLAAMVVLLDGHVLAVGGVNVPGSFTGSTVAQFPGLATTQLYDPSTGTWTQGWDMLAARNGGHRAIRLADGRVLVVGGQSKESYDPGLVPRWSGVLSDPAAEIYDRGAGG